MKERLIAYAYLLRVDLLPVHLYTELLDSLFLEYPDDELLLDLEWAQSPKYEMLSILHIHCIKHPMDQVAFGRHLMKGLEEAYQRFGSDLEGFGERAYALWQHLPMEIQFEKPYRTLNYADDLAYYNEADSRQMYEEMFHYFDR